MLFYAATIQVSASWDLKSSFSILFGVFKYNIFLLTVLTLCKQKTILSNPNYSKLKQKKTLPNTSLITLHPV